LRRSANVLGKVNLLPGNASSNLMCAAVRKSSTYLLVLFLTGSWIEARAQSAYHVVTERSEIRFSVDHMGMLTVEGAFRDVAGSIVVPGDDGDSHEADIRVSTASVDTGNRLRDRSIRTDAFLNTRQYPAIRYTGRATVSGDESVKATGALMLKGQRIPVDIPVELSFSGPDVLHVRASFTVRRSDVNLIFDSSMDSLIGDEIRLIIDLEARPGSAPFRDRSSASFIFGRSSTIHRWDVSKNASLGHSLYSSGAVDRLFGG